MISIMAPCTGLFREDGSIVSNTSSPVLSHDVESVVALISQVYDVVTASTPATEIKAVGLVIPGLLDTDNGVVVAVANFPAMKNCPLVSKVQAVLHKPVFLENDARAGESPPLHKNNYTMILSLYI